MMSVVTLRMWACYDKLVRGFLRGQYLKQTVVHSFVFRPFYIGIPTVHSSLLCLVSIQISYLDLVGMGSDFNDFIGLHVLEAQVWRLNAPS